MLEELKQKVCDANLKLVDEGLVIQTWGNVSGVDRATAATQSSSHLACSYDAMKPEQMVVVSLETGEVVEGDLRPSSDTPTHVFLYRAFAGIGGVVHTHSLYATAWAQARHDIPALGHHARRLFLRPRALHAPDDAGRDSRPTTKPTPATSSLSVSTALTPLEFPRRSVASHAPFAWGATVEKAVENAVVLEYVARLASETLRINADVEIDAAGTTGQALPAQARAGRLLRAEVIRRTDALKRMN